MSNLLTVSLLFSFFLFFVAGLFLFFFFSSRMLQFFLCSFFFFLLDFSSRVPLAFEVLYSVSDSLFGRFYDRLFLLEITHVTWTDLVTAPNRIMLHSHNHDTYTCGNKINNNDERTHFFRKIYLSHFIRNGCKRVTKESCVRGELETEQTATYWPPVPLSLAALLSRSAGPYPSAGCWFSLQHLISN